MAEHRPKVAVPGYIKCFRIEPPSASEVRSSQLVFAPRPRRAARLPRVAVPGRITCFRIGPPSASAVRSSEPVPGSSLPLRVDWSPAAGWQALRKPLVAPVSQPRRRKHSRTIVACPSTAFAAPAQPGRRPDSECRLREYSGYRRPRRPRKRQGTTWKFAWLFLTLNQGRMQQLSG